MNPIQEVIGDLTKKVAFLKYFYGAIPIKRRGRKVEEMCEVKEIGWMTNEQENSVEEEFHSLPSEESMQHFTVEISHEQ